MGRIGTNSDNNLRSHLAVVVRLPQQDQPPGSAVKSTLCPGRIGTNSDEMGQQPRSRLHVSSGCPDELGRIRTNSDNNLRSHLAVVVRSRGEHLLPRAGFDDFRWLLTPTQIAIARIFCTPWRILMNSDEFGQQHAFAPRNRRSVATPGPTTWIDRVDHLFFPCELGRILSNSGTNPTSRLHVSLARPGELGRIGMNSDNNLRSHLTVVVRLLQQDQPPGSTVEGTLFPGRIGEGFGRIRTTAQIAMVRIFCTPLRIGENFDERGTTTCVRTSPPFGCRNKANR